ncbi:hypothetical protein [Nostoc favosum]|uniref:Uncharacterized protein n=1 Tax=Nostoc favosum CHAB5714 TaxID=2780399 RepID=A0ABS8ICN3_9NOSO|nr:hypothetical protein [Nostoc favosum]MCC5601892.1 hypothetical protein [Nostoc favosum CHAB5714]
MFEIYKRRSNPRWNITEDLAKYMFMMPPSSFKDLRTVQINHGIHLRK